MLGLFFTFLKLGTFIFGSGHALASAMQSEIVDRQGWMTAEQFQDGWAAGNVLPGPIATKVVVYVGYEQAGVWGALVAIVAYLLPSITGMVLITAVLTQYAQLPAVKSIVRGVKPAVLALLVEAFLSFTGVAFPRNGALVAPSVPVLVTVGGVCLSLAGMWWMSTTGIAGVGAFL
ncbi:chromate transporter, partial [Candidatus Poribacteria bacterium]|nr:chromate transporter [Candidatus Poribacteria bacterium]